jgi:hypothetical protein
MQTVNPHSNRRLFIPQTSGSPRTDLFTHISSLGHIGRLDFERFHIAGEVIYKVEEDASPECQEDEEARIATLAYAIKKLGDEVNAAEFIRCLNSICDGGDARSRQSIAAHYYREIAARNVNAVLKEMGLLTMQLLTPSIVESEEEESIASPVEIQTDDNARSRREEYKISLFDQELASIIKMVSGGRRVSALQPDDFEIFLDQMILDGFEGDDLAAKVESFENLMQYDESGAIILMSEHQRTTACGRLDSELTAEDLPLRARYLVGELRHQYTSGKSIEALWDDLTAQIEVLFPIAGKSENRRRFYSCANRESQTLCREILETILGECQSDFHLTELHVSPVYRQFYNTVRETKDTKVLGETMKKAYESRQTGALTLKQFTALTTASKLQRIRLENARPSVSTQALVNEINESGTAKLRYLAWAMYGDNQPTHPVHTLPSQQKSVVWQALKTRRCSAQAAAI